MRAWIVQNNWLTGRQYPLTEHHEVSILRALCGLRRHPLHLFTQGKSPNGLHSQIRRLLCISYHLTDHSIFAPAELQELLEEHAAD